MRSGSVGVVAVALRRRQAQAPGEALGLGVCLVAGGPSPLRLRGQAIAQGAGVEAGDLAQFHRVERLQAVAIGEPVAVQRRLLPGDVHHWLQRLIERDVLIAAGVVAGRESAELAIGHFGAAEIEQSGEIGGAQHLVGPPPRLPARGAHANGGGAKQHQLVALAGAAHALEGFQAGFVEGEQAHLEFLREAGLRRHRLLVAGVARLADLDLVRPGRQRYGAGGVAVAFAFQPQLGVRRLRLNGEVAEQGREIERHSGRAAGGCRDALGGRRVAGLGSSYHMAARADVGHERRLAAVVAVHRYGSAGGFGGNPHLCQGRGQRDGRQRHVFAGDDLQEIGPSFVAGQVHAHAALAGEDRHWPWGHERGGCAIHGYDGTAGRGGNGNIRPVRRQRRRHGLPLAHARYLEGKVGWLVARVGDVRHMLSGRQFHLQRRRAQRFLGTSERDGGTGRFHCEVHLAGQLLELQGDGLAAGAADGDAGRQRLVAGGRCRHAMASFVQQVGVAQLKRQGAVHRNGGGFRRGSEAHGLGREDEPQSGRGGDCQS